MPLSNVHPLSMIDTSFLFSQLISVLLAIMNFRFSFLFIFLSFSLDLSVCLSFSFSLSMYVCVSNLLPRFLIFFFFNLPFPLHSIVNPPPPPPRSECSHETNSLLPTWVFVPFLNVDSRRYPRASRKDQLD